MVVPAAHVAATIADFVSVEVINPTDRMSRVRVVAGVWHRTVVAMVRVEVVIHVAMEVVGTVEPRASTDEDAAGEPFGTVVAVGRTAIRSGVIVAVRAVRGGSDVDADTDLSFCLGSSRCKAESSNSREREILESAHDMPLDVRFLRPQP